MAAGKKKKKPTANNARGFATTSIASKPRLETTETAASAKTNDAGHSAAESAQAQATKQEATNVASTPKPEKHLSPEEFERQLEESELQLLVDNHAQKAKRDAQRQKVRLETDRRLLRSQAESINSRKWLPPELVEHILQLLKEEGRYAAANPGADASSTAKSLSEDDLTIKLWTLQQALLAAGFADDKVRSVLEQLVNLGPQAVGAGKDLIWGIDEALDLLARQCDLDELPDYEKHGKAGMKSLANTPADTPLPSGATTPRLFDHDAAHSASRAGVKSASPKKVAFTYDADIEPEQLLPLYLESKSKLLEMERLHKDAPTGKPSKASLDVPLASAEDREASLLQAKIERIERDPLFDRDLAEQQWRARKIGLERSLAAAKKEIQSANRTLEGAEVNEENQKPSSISDEAERIASEILSETIDEDDDGITGLFASLPVDEHDPETGESITVLNGADGSRVRIRDMGKWTGVSPVRILDESCRARYVFFFFAPCQFELL
jgi:ATP-dependent RNA helicase DHX29